MALLKTDTIMTVSRMKIGENKCMINENKYSWVNCVR